MAWHSGEGWRSQGTDGTRDRRTMPGALSTSSWLGPANPGRIFRGPFANLTPFLSLSLARLDRPRPQPPRLLKQNYVHTSSLNPRSRVSASNAPRIRSSVISRTNDGNKEPHFERSPRVGLSQKRAIVETSTRTIALNL